MIAAGRFAAGFAFAARAIVFAARVIAIAAALVCPHLSAGREFELTATSTLTAVELNHGDAFRFQLASGESRSFVLEGTKAWIVEQLPVGIVYAFECRLLADGQPLALRRFACSQESFYEPWVVNGVRIWVSSSAAVFKLVPIRYPENHYKFDAVDAVLALQDATLPICPQAFHPWFPGKEAFIDVGRCYNGDDPWLGPYLGEACHVGLDINMPKGTPLFAPLDFDDQWIFSADHRWRGIRRWENGQIWALQSHHVERLLVPEGTPLKAGQHYAEAAGKGIGSHQHSHFEFRIGKDVLNRGQLGGLELDPWIVFWQIFEERKRREGRLRAEIAPLAPARTGAPVSFRSQATAGSGMGALEYCWTFGDGGCSALENPQHTFVRPGVYPITLVVRRGSEYATQTQHLTVGGAAWEEPALTLLAGDETSFRLRPSFAADVYGWPVRGLPHTLKFTMAAGEQAAGEQASGEQAVDRKAVELVNAGGGQLPRAAPPTIRYLGEGSGWLQVEPENIGLAQRLLVSVAASELPAGTYAAVVSVSCPGAVNEQQTFRVEMVARSRFARREQVVDDRDPSTYATPCAWVGHQLLRAKLRGHQKRYLTNGRLADGQASVRFTPDLAAGTYEVRLHEDTPFVEASFLVRIRHAAGDRIVRVEAKPGFDRSLGVFEFSEGTDGWVEILTRDSRGLVLADAVVFRPR